jgi:hypothetical protein
MRTTLLFALLSFTASAQYYDQNFDGTSSGRCRNTIDTTAGNLWQVGPPQKGFSMRRIRRRTSLCTDTMNNLSGGARTHTFTMKAALDGFWWWSVFFLRFYHAFDTDTLQRAVTWRLAG